MGAAPLSIVGGEAVEDLMARPNPRATGAALLELVAAHLVLHGNAYLYAAEGSDGRAAEIYALAPERVRIETDAQGWPAAFLLSVGRE